MTAFSKEKVLGLFYHLKHLATGCLHPDLADLDSGGACFVHVLENREVARSASRADRTDGTGVALFATNTLFAPIAFFALDALGASIALQTLNSLHPRVAFFTLFAFRAHGPNRANGEFKHIGARGAAAERDH